MSLRRTVVGSVHDQHRLLLGRRDWGKYKILNDVDWHALEHVGLHNASGRGAELFELRILQGVAPLFAGAPGLAGSV